MKKIVIIGANEFQNPLILKAKEMGYETHVFAWRDGAIGEKTADFFYPISIIEKEKILEKCREIQPDAVASIASDLAGITVNYLERNLGISCNSAHNIIISTNKYEMRKTFQEHNIATPGFVKVTSKKDLAEVREKLSLPIIVKPTDRSGSRGIMKLESFDGLEQAVQNALADSFENAAIVEEYIEGDEYSCECISYQGQHHFLAVTKKYTTGYPHFIEIGHIEPSGLDVDMLEKVKGHIFSALDALEVEFGASHSEFKITADGKIQIIEIGSRMGGDCIGSDLVQLSTGYDFVKGVIQVAAGEAPDLIRKKQPKIAAIRFILTEDDMKRYEIVKENHPDKLHYVSRIQMQDTEIMDSSSRYGYYIVACDTVDEALEMTGLW